MCKTMHVAHASKHRLVLMLLLVLLLLTNYQVVPAVGLLMAELTFVCMKEWSLGTSSNFPIAYAKSQATRKILVLICAPGPTV
jgi:hypothetical protein